MNLFSTIRYYKDRLKPHGLEEIVSSRKSAARGYVFIVELDGKYYMLVNGNDLNVALSQLPSKTLDTINLSSRLLDVPITDSEHKAHSIQNGVFKWASRL